MAEGDHRFGEAEQDEPHAEQPGQGVGRLGPHGENHDARDNAEHCGDQDGPRCAMPDDAAWSWLLHT
jgi:hypothetical protein